MVRFVRSYGLDENEIERLGLGGDREKKVWHGAASGYPGSKEPTNRRMIQLWPPALGVANHSRQTSGDASGEEGVVRWQRDSSLEGGGREGEITVGGAHADLYNVALG
jgi:hypothetical protein